MKKTLGTMMAAMAVVLLTATFSFAPCRRHFNLEVDIFGKALYEAPSLSQRSAAREDRPDVLMFQCHQDAKRTDDMPVLFNQT